MPHPAAHPVRSRRTAAAIAALALCLGAGIVFRIEDPASPVSLFPMPSAGRAAPDEMVAKRECAARAIASSRAAEPTKEQLPAQGRYESLAAAVSAARHAADAIDSGGVHSRGAKYFAANPTQQLRAWFREDGVELASGRANPKASADETGAMEPWSLALRLKGSGRPGALVTAGKRGVLAHGSRVEISDPAAGLTEWYENKADGLEQGFTFQRPPQIKERAEDGAANTGANGITAEPLEIVMAVTGNLRAESIQDEGKTGVRFVNPEGEEIVRYSKLKAWDVTGRILPGEMQVREGNELVLLINDSGARYPITIDPLFTHTQARLAEETAERDDAFGDSLALDGNTALVGAVYDSSSTGEDVGSVYVFVRSGAGWVQQAKLTASDAAPFSYFGDAVALEGDTALIGASEEEVGAGSAYVFIRAGSTWSQQAKLTASDRGHKDSFGKSVALKGDTALIGAYEDNTLDGEDTGSAYVFIRNGLSWSQQAKLMAPDGVKGSHFGFSVSLTQDLALIGAPYAANFSGKTGAAYLYARSGTSWSQRQKLEVFNDPGLARFGNSVALDGQIAVIGAPDGDSIAGVNAGSAYVFVSGAGSWGLETTLTAADGDSYDSFGSSVALSGATVLVAAPQSDPRSTKESAGSAYVFVRSGGGWAQQLKLTAPASLTERFALSVALQGEAALVGATSVRGIGNAYSFVRNGSTWQAQSNLESTSANHHFGSAVAMDGDLALIGVPFDDAPFGSDSGSAYLFKRSGDLWIQEAKLAASDAATSDNFGAAVALSGTSAIIGAPGADTAAGLNAGCAYAFSSDGVAWRQQGKMISSVGVPGSAFGSSVALEQDRGLVGGSGACVFTRIGGMWVEEAVLTDAGSSVALSGDTALVGIPEAEAYAGRARIFVRRGATWELETELNPLDSAQYSNFGHSVALQGNTALVGMPYGDLPAGANAGAAYFFARTGAAWVQEGKLTARDAASNDSFGLAVAFDGDRALVTAPFQNTATVDRAGAAYVFTRSEKIWTEQARLGGGINSSQDDYFGASAAIEGSVALVGAKALDASGPNSGAVYVFLIGSVPEITAQPQSKNVIPGTAVTFFAGARGYAPLAYQWRKDGVDIPGAAGASDTSPFTASFTISSAQPADGGSYDLVISNLGGTATSAPATLRINALSQFTRILPGPLNNANGELLVKLTPSGIGAAWRFVGEHHWRPPGTTVRGLPVGNRDIEFRPVAGYLHPLRMPASIAAGGMTQEIQREYYLTKGGALGSLSVALEPASIAPGNLPVERRAQWRLLGEDDTKWRDSGVTLPGLRPGTYLVETKPVEAWSTPPPRVVVVHPSPADLAQVVVLYSAALAASGTVGQALPFESVTGSSQGGSSSLHTPYPFVGQIRSEQGSATGFVVGPRVVATAAHVVFDDAELSVASLGTDVGAQDALDEYAAKGLHWLFQRHAGDYEPLPQVPRGFYVLSGYAAQRIADRSPGASSVESQSLDVAALYFTTADAGRAGYSGYVASDDVENEWLLSARRKTLVGYPVDGISAANQGRMHATPAADVKFTHSYGRGYVSSEITSRGGASGGPLCVEHDDGAFYPAAIYVGGSSQAVVRAIDSSVIELFKRAAESADGGENHNGTGITHVNAPAETGGVFAAGLQVHLSPSAAAASGARWKLAGGVLSHAGGVKLASLCPGNYTLNFLPVAGYRTPASRQLTLTGGNLTIVRAAYAPVDSVPRISNRAMVDAMRGEPMRFALRATPAPSSFNALGLEGTGLVLNRISGVISGRPLAAGTFTITVIAENTFGSSAPFELAIRVVEPGDLVIEGGADPTGGTVSVSPKARNNRYPQGETVTLIAKPDAPGFVFSGWEIDGSTADDLTRAKVSFPMTDRVVAKANFIPNPFITRAGRYDGLLTDSQGEAAGAFTALVATSGAFSVKVRVDGALHQFRGRFGLDGRSQGTISRAASSSLVVDLLLDFNSNPPRISGRVSTGEQSLELSAVGRRGYSRTEPAPAQGRHTLALLRPAGEPEQPNAYSFGDGYAVLEVSSAGDVRAFGQLGDGTPFAAGGVLQADEQWPVYVQPYHSGGSWPRSGLLAGVVDVGGPDGDPSGVPETRDATSNGEGMTISGSLSWKKPPAAVSSQAAKYYPRGFSERLQAIGSRYRKPPPGAPAMDIADWAVSFESDVSDASPVASATVTLRPDNRFAVAEASSPLKMRVRVSTGVFFGTINLPGADGGSANGAAVKIQGVLLQGAGIGCGVFKLPQHAGAVRLGWPAR